MTTFYHDPDAVAIDYGIDWYKWLGTDTINSSYWFSQSAHVLVVQHTFTASSTKAWVSIASASRIDGAVYSLTNRIATDGGRQGVDKTIYLRLKDA